MCFVDLTVFINLRVFIAAVWKDPFIGKFTKEISILSSSNTGCIVYPVPLTSCDSVHLFVLNRDNPYYANNASKTFTSIFNHMPLMTLSFRLKVWIANWGNRIVLQSFYAFYECSFLINLEIIALFGCHCSPEYTWRSFGLINFIKGVPNYAVQIASSLAPVRTDKTKISDLTPYMSRFMCLSKLDLVRCSWKAVLSPLKYLVDCQNCQPHTLWCTLCHKSAIEHM